MSTDIKNYLKYYLGCEAFFDNRKWLIDFYDVRQNIVRLRRTDDGYPKYNEVWPNEMKLILRRLSSITEEEIKELINWEKMNVVYMNLKFKKFDQGINIMYDIDTGDQGIYPQFHYIKWYELSPDHFHWFLSRGFWLFDQDAFEKGLIIEKK